MYIIAFHEQHDQCHWRFSKCVTFRIILFYFWHFVGVDSVDFRSNVRVAFVMFILNLIIAVTVHPFHDLPLVTFFIGFCSNDIHYRYIQLFILNLTNYNG